MSVCNTNTREREDENTKLWLPLALLGTFQNGKGQNAMEPKVGMEMLEQDAMEPKVG